MNALELKQKLKNADNHLTLLKIFGLSILISCIVFPINYLVNPNIDPIIHEQPILLAFGFVAFVMMFAVLIVGGLVTTLIGLESYLLVSPRVADSYWNMASKFILRERFKKNTADGIWDFVKLHRKHDVLYQADLEQRDKQIEELTKRVDEYEVMILPHIARQNRNDYDQNLRIKNLEATVAEIKQLLETKQPEDNIPLDVLEKLTNKVLELEEEIKKLKGE